MMELMEGLVHTIVQDEDDSDDDYLTEDDLMDSVTSIVPDSLPLQTSMPEIESSDMSEATNGRSNIMTKKYGNGEIYEGPMMNGMRHGENAVSIRADGSKYSGSYHSDEPLQGTLITSKYTYVGSFRNGRFHGLATLMSSDGTMYYGEFENGLPHGVGKETAIAGDEEMEMIQDIVSQKDTDFSSSPKATLVTYSGDFLAGKRHGLGTLVHLETETCLYSGLFINGRQAQFKKDEEQVQDLTKDNGEESMRNAPQSSDQKPEKTQELRGDDDLANLLNEVDEEKKE